MKKKLSLLYSRKQNTIQRHHALWEIPVCYDKKFGIDLDFLSMNNGLDVEKIISLHSSPIYTVFGIGFLPGFLYLGGLPKELHVPRRSQPRSIEKRFRPDSSESLRNRKNSEKSHSLLLLICSRNKCSAAVAASSSLAAFTVETQ